MERMFGPIVWFRYCLECHDSDSLKLLVYSQTREEALFLKRRWIRSHRYNTYKILRSSHRAHTYPLTIADFHISKQKTNFLVRKMFFEFDSVARAFQEMWEKEGQKPDRVLSSKNCRVYSDDVPF